MSHTKEPSLVSRAKAIGLYNSRLIDWVITVEQLTKQRDKLLVALEKLLRRDMINTCQHEETHRGGSIWEICNQCGASWADDRGGKPEWKDPKEWADAFSAIDSVKACGAQQEK